VDLHLPRLVAIAFGGAVGAVCRYAIVLASVRAWGDWFPLGVLFANVLGCFLLGLLMHDRLVTDGWLATSGHAALTVGLLGALTTFSTFGYDTLRLLEASRYAAAAINVAANCTVGIAACWLGHLVGDMLWPTAS
jgi:fluoride exporter